MCGLLTVGDLQTHYRIRNRLHPGGHWQCMFSVRCAELEPGASRLCSLVLYGSFIHGAGHFELSDETDIDTIA